jgi:hypothetical protein
MIQLIKRYSIATALSALVLVTGCDEEEKNVTPVSAQFTVGSITTSEAGAEQTITLPFSDAIMANGTIEVTFTSDNATYGEDFVTIPGGSTGSVKLNVTKGQTAAQFKVIPIDNEIMNEVSTVKLTLSNPSSALAIGSQSEVSITFTDNEGPTKVDFATNQSELFENVAEGSSIEILLTSPATGEGTTVVSFTSDGAYGTDFITVPAAVDGKISIQNAIGDEAISFQILPLNDVSVNADIVIETKIENASGGVELGTNLTHTVTIKDDETPSTASFATASGTGLERETSGIVVPVSFTPALGNAGTLELALSSTNATYGTDYTTEPAATNGKVTLSVSQGESGTTFKVIPVNNSSENANLVVKFSMTASTGVVVIGASGDTYELTIADDDHVSTLAELRALYTGTNVVLPIGTNIRGTVISKNDNVTSRNVYIQDATAGILIRFDANNSFVITDDIQVDISGATLTEFNGNLQVTTLTNDKAVKKGIATLPAYQVISVTELNTNLNAYESELVQVENSGFTQADGATLMPGSRTASDGTTQFVVRTETYATWKTEVIPYGIGTMRGVATEFNGTSQLLPQVYADDISLQVGTKAITVTQSITDFGSVQKGQTSSSKQYTVQGTDLAYDLTITASAGFEVSKNNTDFSSSVSFTSAESIAAQTVYVRFAPNMGTDQAIAGTIKHTSLGAPTQSFAVSGTEFGNTSTRLLNENFEYASVDTDIVTASSSVWSHHSGTLLTGDPQFTNTGLTYSGYGASGVGGAVTFVNTQTGDVNRQFTDITTTSDIYVSFLLNLSAVGATATGDYFFHFSNGPLNTGNLKGKVFAFMNSTGWSIGLQKSGETRANSSTVLAFGQTYLVVLKYSYNTGIDNDTAQLYVYESGVPASESSPALVTLGPTATGTGDLADVGSIAIRQTTNGPNGTIDGIRVARIWSDLFN